MKQLFALILSVFCLSMLNATPTKNGTLKKTSFDFENEKKVDNSHKGLLSILPCNQPSTTTATQTFQGCTPGTTITVSKTVTCVREGATCDEAAFLALQCSYLGAWGWVMNQQPVCPPE